MTMLAERNENKALTLADYEARIHLYKEQIGTGYIGIGRTLTEAKAARVVPHGEWEAWVTRTTGLSPRQAQRCMQAAEEIRDGSALARLEMSKALALLSSGLDRDEQEALAEKAAAENTTLRSLQDEVKRLKLQVVESTGAAADIREKLKAAEAERDQVSAQLRSTFTKMQDRLNEETGKAYERGRTECARDAEREIRKEFDRKIEFLNGQKAMAEEAVKDLRKQLQNAQIEAGSKWDQGFTAGQSEAELMQKKVRKLERDREDLLAAAEEAEKRAAAAEARAEAAEGNAPDPNRDATRQLRRAVSAFLDEVEDLTDPAAFRGVGLLPLELCVQDVEEWCGRMRQALDRAGAVAGEGVIV